MEGSSSVYKLERVSEVVSVRPALRTGVVAVGHAAALRYEVAGGAGGRVVALLRGLLVSGGQHHRPGLAGETLPDGGGELRPAADSFELGPVSQISEHQSIQHWGNKKESKF